MKEEFIELYVKNNFHTGDVTDENMAAFARICFIMYATTIDTTCIQCLDGYKVRIREFWNNQLSKGFVPPVYDSPTSALNPKLKKNK